MAPGIIEGRHDDIAGYQHFARGFGVVTFVDVPEARATEVRQAECSPNHGEEEIMADPCLAVLEHSLVPRGKPGIRRPDYNWMAVYRESSSSHAPPGLL